VAHRWHYATSGGADASGPDVEFADQTDAEQWLGEHWQELLDLGVDEVTLLDGSGAEVYGPMSLHPPDQ
jgi:hypothetical protein